MSGASNLHYENVNIWVQSWLSFESSIPTSFVTCLLTVQNLVMRLHIDVTCVDLNYVGHFYWYLWPNNRIVMTEFWKCNTYVNLRTNISHCRNWVLKVQYLCHFENKHIALWQTVDPDMFIASSKPGHEITFGCYFWGLKLCWSFLLMSLSLS